MHAARATARPMPILFASAGLFLSVGAFTALWMGLNQALPELRASGLSTAVIRPLLHALILCGLWLGLAGTSFDRSTRIAIWSAIAIPFTLWLAVVWVLAAQGLLVQPPGSRLPRIPLAILVPVIAGLVLLLRSRRVAAILDATPPHWLIALQTYRVFGGIFLVAWANGNLSGTFALPAGIGDVAVGLLALPVAYWLRARGPGAHSLAIAWNIFGLADFAIAIGIGFLSAPGPLQLIVPDGPNTQLGTYPTVMIPAFAVPSSILLHALSIWQLQRRGRRSAPAKSA